MVVALRASDVERQGAVLIDVAASPVLHSAAKGDPRVAVVLREASRQRELLLFANNGFVLDRRMVCADERGFVALPPGFPKPAATISLASIALSGHAAGVSVKVTGEAVHAVHGFDRPGVEAWLIAHNVVIAKTVRADTASRPGTQFVLELPVPTEATRKNSVVYIDLAGFVAAFGVRNH